MRSSIPNPDVDPSVNWSPYVKALYVRRAEPPLGAVGTVYTDKLEQAAKEKLLCQFPSALGFRLR